MITSKRNKKGRHLSALLIFQHFFFSFLNTFEARVRKSPSAMMCYLMTAIFRGGYLINYYYVAFLYFRIIHPYYKFDMLG